MSVVSPGFRGRRRPEQPELPPGQYLTEDFPVLSGVALLPQRKSGIWNLEVYGGNRSGNIKHGKENGLRFLAVTH
jgi:hypothetical protein